MPHLNADPVVTAAHLITSLQTLISRETSPLGSAVLSVTLMRAGDAYNVIPNIAEFGGTIRWGVVSLQTHTDTHTHTYIERGLHTQRDTCTHTHTHRTTHTHTDTDTHR